METRLLGVDIRTYKRSPAQVPKRFRVRAERKLKAELKRRGIKEYELRTTQAKDPLRKLTVWRIDAEYHC